MKHQANTNGSRLRRTAKYRFALALAAGLLSCQESTRAEDGIRELREPSDMQKVAPVRAVGIRLSPAAPLDLNKTSSPKEPLPSSPSATLPTTPTTPLPSLPIPAHASTPNSTPNSNSVAPTTKASESSAALVSPAASPVAASPAPANAKPVNAASKAPERIVPKSKVSESASNKQNARSPLIKAQSPIHMNVEPSEAIRTASAPPASLQQSDVTGLVATEAKSIEGENPRLSLSAPSTVTTPSPRNQSETSAPSSTPEWDHAVRMDIDVQTSREIAIDFPIRSVVVQDEKICRAMSSGGYVYVVGLSLGESILEVKPADDRPSRFFRIKVAAPWQRSGGVADLEQLVHAIQPLNPNGVLTVRALEDGSVVVQGKVENKETAKRIMELTRKLILVPVVDKLEIR